MHQSRRLSEQSITIACERPSFEGSNQLNATSHPTRPRISTKTGKIESADSSHRSVLAREATAMTQMQSRQSGNAQSRQATRNRRPSTPASLLNTLDEDSPPSASTMSPRTPTSYTALDSQRYTPLELERSQKSVDRLRIDPEHPTFDPASTYQPRRAVHTAPPHQHISQVLKPLTAEETSFMEWDDDTSKFQRVKQSFAFSLPNRPKKMNTVASKSPDNHSNSTTRLQIRTSVRESHPDSDQSTHVRTSTYNRPQPRTSQTHVRTNSAPGQTLPMNAVVSRDASYMPPKPPKPVPHGYTINEHKPLPRLPCVAEANPPQYRNWDDYDYADSTAKHEEHMPAVSPSSTTESTAPKSKRIKDIMKGVVQRVSKRDLKQEAEGDS